jgi:hypothetical protein
MMFTSLTHRVAALAFAALLSVAASAAQAQTQAQDEPLTFNAFAVVKADGSILKSAEKQATVVAALTGALFVETDEGPVAAGRVACSGTIKIDLDTSRQTGSGACTSTADDGATTFGEWQCAGFAMLGCRGAYKLTGGTGRMAGYTGQATLIFRPNAHDLQKQLDGTVLQNTTGILIWRDFKIAKN